MTPTLLVVCATAVERDAAAGSLPGPAVPGRRTGAETAGPDGAGTDGAGTRKAGTGAAGTDGKSTDGAAPDLVRLDTPAGRVDLLVGGIGVAAAAAMTSAVLARGDYDVVLSAGIAGAFAPVAVGATVVATAVVQADLGAEDGSRFLPLSALGLGAERHELDPALVTALATRTGADRGAVLTVSTVTGSAPTAAARRTRCPDALAEAMEGAGVLAAARVHGVAFAEVRTVSNAIGPRERESWQIAPALTALGRAVAAITAAPWELPS